jgi:predicted site-specific integrase-resolvase
MNLITSKETAQILGCSITTISKMVRKGLLKPINPQKGFCLFDNNKIQRLSDHRTANDIRCFTVEDKKSKTIRARDKN